METSRDTVLLYLLSQRAHRIHLFFSLPALSSVPSIPPLPWYTLSGLIRFFNHMSIDPNEYITLALAWKWGKIQTSSSTQSATQSVCICAVASSTRDFRKLWHGAMACTMQVVPVVVASPVTNSLLAWHHSGLALSLSVRGLWECDLWTVMSDFHSF